MNRLVYLCGPITGLDYTTARYGWREQVTLEAARHGIVCVSPMRAKGHLAHVQSFDKMGDTHVLDTPRGVTTRDRWDVQRSAVIFANFLGAERVSAGSMIEFGWADAARVPILCVMEEGNVHEHAIASELIGWRCHSLEEGIAVLTAVLSEGL